ncbi:MAG: ATP-binding protein, partial [Muribaculum sp.]|nr:ATP-binding protein [Muribaculum sp.]
MANDTTVLVGANNSGKTSAIMAFKKFLSSESRFLTRDFTLYLWKTINENFGKVWESLDENTEYVPFVTEWIDLLPTFDLWISASEEE